MLNLGDPLAKKVIVVEPTTTTQPETPEVKKGEKHNPVMVFLTTLAMIAVVIGVAVVLVALRDDFVEIIKSLF